MESEALKQSFSEEEKKGYSHFLKREKKNASKKNWTEPKIALSWTQTKTKTKKPNTWLNTTTPISKRKKSRSFFAGDVTATVDKILEKDYRFQKTKRKDGGE